LKPIISIIFPLLLKDYCIPHITLLVSLIIIAGSYEVTLPYFSYLPLINLSFNWVIPAIVGGIAVSFIKSSNKGMNYHGNN